MMENQTLSDCSQIESVWKIIASKGVLTQSQELKMEFLSIQQITPQFNCTISPL